MSILNGFNQVDESLKATRALPNGAATVASSGIDTGPRDVTRDSFTIQHNLVIDAPALNATQLPNTQTMKYSVYHDSDSAFGSESLLMADVVVQTGASDEGAAAAEGRVVLPPTVKRYVRVKATKSGSGDATGASAVITLRLK